MTIYPAIDLKNGEAVRLTKGVMESAKVYSSEPYHIARAFEEMGADWVHIVDLNGAFAGNPENLQAIKKIREATTLKLQLGGGIRDEETIKKYMDLGISRVILGTIATQNPQFVKEVAAKYRVAVGIDVKDGFVAVDGWAKTSELRATELARMFADSGVDAIITTDISRDGMLSGVNIAQTEEIASSCGIDTIASGGVKDIMDIEAVKNSQLIEGVIIGKAYYEGKLDLREALALQ
ncbi:MAG: 1-(5-phosphoribosyl)-5-[(5-phosphoribosylamino)methylideneamino]imidazole-4-carboxamide isomerase [Campylobacterales bacterium]|nr:1-(5-phosphoribosyl)-5-[(5-phosphoribosylamino)methylideneamino]imidazole-4-carboxamide isomerase [Campylobacterales bacterium]